METKYKEPQKIKSFNFNKFTSGITTSNEDDEKEKKLKFDLKNINFNTNPNNPNDMDPIQTNNSIETEFDEEDAIKSFTNNNNN